MTDRPRYPRSGCVVPFCRRTSTLFKGEWICGEHWRLVSRDLKRFRTKSRRRWDRKVAVAEAVRQRADEQVKAHFGEGGPGTVRTIDVDAYTAADEQLRRAEWGRWRAWNGIWRRMKRQAIERAGGIA